MSVIERSFPAAVEPARVVAFLQDLRTTELWDPGTEWTRQLGDAPVQVGTQWRNRSTLFGVSTELTFTLVHATATELRFSGDNARAHTVDSITVVPAAGGSLVTYRFEVIMKGWSKLSAPLMRLAFERVGTLVARRMPQVLEQHA